jgi:hypothetical protein
LIDAENLQTDLFRETIILLITRLGLVAVPLKDLAALFQTARAIATAA